MKEPAKKKAAEKKAPKISSPPPSTKEKNPKAVAAGKLVPILGDYTRPPTPAWAVYPHTRHLSLRVRAFIDHLADWFAGELSWDRCCEQAVR